MSVVGPDSQVTDSEGGKYTLKKELGSGVEARTFKATVDHATKGNKTVRVGDPVAVKVLNPAEGDEKAADRLREQKVLEREGTLIAKKLPKAKDEDKQSYMIVPIFPGVTLQKAIYPEFDKHVGIGNKRDLPAETKEGFAVTLLLDQYALQLCGIVHCDLKSDNILADPESRTAKIIDMGEGFIAAEGSFTNTYRGPGAIFEAPETREPDGYKIHLNSFKTDLYALGAILGAMYSEKNYERDAPSRGANLTVAARDFIADITAPDVVHKEGMPDSLLSVIRSLLTVDPNARPASIALASGIDQHPGLQAIVQAHQELTQFKNTELRADVAKIVGDRHVSPEFKDRLNNIFDSNPDLPTMRVKLAELCKSFPNEKAGIKQVTALGEKIDNACMQQARNIQAIRVNMLAEHAVKQGQQMYVDSVRGLAGMLEAKAKQHKNDGTAMLFGSRAPVSATQLDDVGKLLMITSKTIALMHEPIEPRQVEMALNGLRKAIDSIPKEKFGPEGESAKQKLISDVDKIQKMHASAIDQIPKIEPVRPSTPTPMRSANK